MDSQMVERAPSSVDRARDRSSKFKRDEAKFTTLFVRAFNMLLRLSCSLLERSQFV